MAPYARTWLAYDRANTGGSLSANMMGYYRANGDKRVYEYTTQFWYCVPGLADALLDGDPLQSETRLKSGVTLSCVPASENAARG